MKLRCTDVEMCLFFNGKFLEIIAVITSVTASCFVEDFCLLLLIARNKCEMIRKHNVISCSKGGPSYSFLE